VGSILLDFHNKLGDNLVCNGLVREYCKRYARVGIFCIPRYVESVSFMFRDLHNLRLEVVSDHRHKQYFLWRHRLHLTARRYDEVKKIYNDPEVGILAERQFYGLAGVPHEKKWESFFVERDSAREQVFFDRVVLASRYQFVHDDDAYGRRMRRNTLNAALPTVEAHKSLTANIFDYCSVIERAEEIHVVDSVFMFLVDLLTYDNPKQKLFVHRYARANPPWYLPVLKKDWTILE
jgi:hypothetical protein